MKKEQRLQPDKTGTRPPKKGLLVAPRFPANSFWSYRYILELIDRKAVFPPLGLLTLAADMPSHWDFKLIDLNVRQPPPEELRREIADADAVFASAMSIQKRSLVELLRGPAGGLDTPWVIGGPFASTYRDQILKPKTESDWILHQGLDLVVWGEGSQWVEAVDRFLAENPRHSPDAPTLFIPEAVLRHKAGSRKYLNDRAIFKPLEEAPAPRWDLIRPEDYRSLMIQTTLGCPFRCDFCDIIDFNGGFTRVKTVDGVRRELEAIYATGHRGGVFTVDDNFIGNPKEISRLLDVMTEFQRERDYPFSFYTQASVNLGTPKLEYLIRKMRHAGFSAVFLGIENPDPAALDLMNKKQNKMVDIPATVNKIQDQGIEVYAGFIFGSDSDTTDTAAEIVRFVRENAIFSAMTGMLTPVPYTPLYEELKAQGRLLDTEYTGNNTDDAVQFVPGRMTREEMQDGIYRILEDLFNLSESYRRAGDMLGRIQQHIFARKRVEGYEVGIGFRSLWRHGIRRLDTSYFKLLWNAVALDWKRAHQAGKEKKLLESLRVNPGQPLQLKLGPDGHPLLNKLLAYSQEYLIRFKPEMSLQQVTEYTRELGERLQSGVVSAMDVQRLYEASWGFLQARKAIHTFPGRHLAHALELAVKASHYEEVMKNIVARRLQPI